MDANTLYKVRNTTIEMLIDRGYSMEENVNYDEFKVMYEQNNMEFTDKNKSIHVFFYNDLKTFTKKDLELYTTAIREKYETPIKILLIVRDKYNAMVDTELAKADYKDVEIFLAPTLIINITKRQSIPKHIILSEEEEKAVLEKYQVNKSQLNLIKMKDPIAKYYGLNRGQIVKIERLSPSAGEYINYRCVV